MRLVVTGGRNFHDRNLVSAALIAFEARYGAISCLIHGGARGLDTLCGEWAKANGREVLQMNAEWHLWGKQAGFIRNEAMILQGKPDRGLAFKGGNGTRHMMGCLEKHGIPYEIVG